jgi:hypothetical protein
MYIFSIILATNRHILLSSETNQSCVNSGVHDGITGGLIDLGDILSSLINSRVANILSLIIGLHTSTIPCGTLVLTRTNTSDIGMRVASERRLGDITGCRQPHLTRMNDSYILIVSNLSHMPPYNRAGKH